MRTVLCLIASNTFMTYAWYGHLKKGIPDMPLFKLILISWGIAFFEYLFMVPANNRFGKLEGFSPFQLKTIQEVISLIAFAALPSSFSKNPSGGIMRWPSPSSQPPPISCSPCGRSSIVEEPLQNWPVPVVYGYFVPQSSHFAYLAGAAWTSGI